MQDEKRLHFGVVLSTFDDPCAYDTWRGITAYAKRNDIHLSAYIGTYETAGYKVVSHYDACFEAIRQNNTLDGLIILSGFISHDMEYQQLEEYIQSIPKRIPTVSLMQYIPGVTSVIIDNMGGMYDVANHLIRVHKKSKIAFVKGPEGLDEAEERFEGYISALRDNDIEFDKNLVFSGDFTQKSGQFAVRKLLKKGKDTFDAIIASNDRTAVGVISELNRNDILVPYDVAVAGFDDAWFAKTFIPSISTAKQNFGKLGSTGIKILHSMTDAQAADEVTFVSPVFEKRQSCGCIDSEYSERALNLDRESIITDSLSSHVRQSFRNLFKGNLPESKTDAWAGLLTDMITEKPFATKRFLDLLNQLLLNFNHCSKVKNYSLWNGVLGILTMGTELYPDEIEDAYSTRHAFIQAAALVEAYKFRNAKIKEFGTDDDQRRLRRVAGSLMVHTDVESLSKELQKSLPTMKIYTALLGLYQNPVKKGMHDAERVVHTVIGVDAGDIVCVSRDDSGQIEFFDYGAIETFDFQRMRRDLMFYPLFFGDEELGVMLISFNTDIPIDTYETLRTSLSSAVKGMNMLRAVQKLSITDEHTGLYNRRGFFQMAQSRLAHYSRHEDVVPLVMFLDMDGLKFINDNFGHNEGDTAIRAFAAILRKVLREEDIIGRVGGDEFVVFSSVRASESPSESAKLIENRLREELAAYNMMKKHPYDVMSSIGSVLLESSTMECFEAAMLTADDVLYEEKAAKKKKGISRE